LHGPSIRVNEIMPGIALEQRSDPKAAGHLAEWLRKICR
jgi:hypothetical protein